MRLVYWSQESARNVFTFPNQLALPCLCTQALNINRVVNFPFPTPPDTAAMEVSVHWPAFFSITVP